MENSVPKKKDSIQKENNQQLL